MTPQRRAVIFLASTFALMAPYLAFAVYFSLRFSGNQLPAWFTNTLLIWFIANFLLLMLIVRRLSRGQVVDPEKSRRASAMTQTLVSYLLIVWSLLFLYGAKETIQGKLPVNRAIPAGAFLLFFIALFGWSLYRARRQKNVNSCDESSR